MAVGRVTVDEESVRRAVRRLFGSQPRLRAFPVLTMLVSIPLLFVLLWVFKRVMLFLLLLWSPLSVPFGLGLFLVFLQAFVVAMSVFVGGFALVVAANNAAVVHNVGRALDDEPVSVLAGLGAAVRVLPQLAVLSLVWAEGGGVFYSLKRREHPGRLATIVTRVLGIDVAGSMYFAVPAAVLDGTGPVEMFRTSYRITEAAFDGPTIVSFGFVRGTVLGYGLPVWLLVGVVVPVDAILGPGSSPVLIEEYPLLVGGVPMALLWLGACTGFAYAATAKTLLYLGVTGDRETVPLVERPVAELVG